MNEVSDNEIDLMELVTNESLSDNGIIKNAVWKNFCIADTYEPGSTMKPFTVAAAIDSANIKGMRPMSATEPWISDSIRSTAITDSETVR